MQTELPIRPSDAPVFHQLAGKPAGWRHRAAVAAGIAAVHFTLLLVASVLHSLPDPPRRMASEVRVENRAVRVTPLIAPPSSVLTQRAPNKGPVSQEFNAASLAPRPASPNVPASPGAAAAPRQKFQLPGTRASSVPDPKLPDAPAPPEVSVATNRPAAPPPNLGVPSPPPQIQQPEKPKISFETPGAPTGVRNSGGVGRIPIPRPGASVDETARQVARGGGAGLVVGDTDDSPGISPSAPSVPVPGRLGSAVELLSDPQGVDFRPYLLQILSTVRRNWRSIIPESARMGRQGRTSIQFAIERTGVVSKVVISGPSGADALDRAAVSSISMSNPFPPLPPDFRGGQVRLQFVFKYNLR